MNSIPENQVLYGVFDVSENMVLSVVPDADTANLEREVQIIHHYNSDVKTLKRQIEAMQSLDPESSDDEPDDEPDDSDDESSESSEDDLEGDIDRVTKQVLKMTELENLQMQLEDKRVLLSKVKSNLKIVKIEVQ
jgi:hypothetical protein